MNALTMVLMGFWFVPPAAIKVEHVRAPLVELAQNYGSGLPHLWSIQGLTTPPDESALFVAIWSLNEASGTRANRTGTTCAADTSCDLTESAGDTVVNSTTNVREGTASASFVRADNEWLQCTDATCNELDTTGSMSWGFWLRPQSTGIQHNTMVSLDASATDGWYSLITTTNLHQCFGSAVLVDSFSLNSTSTITANTFMHGACTFDEPADTARNYFNAINEASDTAFTGNLDDANQFDIGNWNLSNNGVDGQVDEAFVIFQALSAAEVCHICSCQIDGTRGQCRCDGTAYFDRGLNVSNCGTCTLPASCADPIS